MNIFRCAIYGIFISMSFCIASVSAQNAGEKNLDVLFKELEALAVSHQKQESTEANETETSLVFTKKAQKPWYRKINYFGNITRESRSIAASRDTSNLALSNSELLVDYDTWLLSFTMGGNIFKRTSVNWDLTSEQYILEGTLVETNLSGSRNASPVRYTRHKLLSEWFIEHDLSGGLTVGGDVYHGQSRYRDSRIDAVFTDKEYGGGLLLSKKFNYDNADLGLDYILSYRRLDPGDEVFETQSRTFHSLLANYHHQFNFKWQADISARYSWYPSFDPESFWDARNIYSIASEMVFHPWDAHQFALKFEHVWIGKQDTMKIVSLNYETEFGAKSSKRRKRRRRIPNLLIR
ncbi:hypothetical protein [Alteromonas sp. a30]|uniref:hypothetical protein n=1 Tax=Alteromonas sp. a30 TaxID=2730917 RepID=UPI0022822479|nr:hypothetical protein [Alteromonas sp. a30]MCY7296504.1 hypothetical protein [Alteromonas sp. a30]